MSDLSPDDQRLLDLARGAHDPTDSDRARGRAALLAGLRAGAGLGVTTFAAGAMGGVKVLAATALVVAAIGGGVFVAYDAAQPPHGSLSVPGASLAAAPPVASGTLTAPVVSASRRPLSALDRTSSPLAPENAVAPTHPAAIGLAKGGAVGPSRRSETVPSTATPLPFEAPAGATPISGQSAMPSTPADRAPRGSGVQPGSDGKLANSAPDLTPPAVTSVEDEMRLVRDGVAALRAGDALAALALFDDHAGTYPNGVLAEERAGERVLALCTLNRLQDARTAAEAFLRTFPSSPLAARVRASCASNP